MKLTKRLAALFLILALLITSVPMEFIVPMTAFAAETTTLTVTGDVVNVRSGAGTSYSKVTTVTQSTVLTSLGTAKDSSGTTWYKVKVNGSTGYIISTFVKASTTSSADSTLTVTGTTVYVRKGAGTSYDYITTVKKGASYTVLGSAKDSSGKTWYKISINNTTGYIISTYVKVSETTATTTTQAPTSGSTTTTAAAQKQLKVTGDIVNVRKGAGTSYGKVTTVKEGAVYKIQGSAKGSDGKTWYKISVNGTVGYIVSTYVKVSDVTTTTTTTKSTTKTTTTTKSTQNPIEITTSKSTAATTASTTTAYTGTTLAPNISVTIAANGVEMRSGAGEFYSLMTTLKEGNSVVILSNRIDSQGELWYRVMYASVSGYIKAEDLSGASSNTTTTTTTTTAASAATTVPSRGTTSRRTTTSTSTTTSRTTTSTKTSQSFSDGIQILVPTTTTSRTTASQTVALPTGDISESTTTNNSVDTRVVKHGTVKCDTTLNVRSNASTDAKVLGTVRNGTQVVIIETLSGWYKIEYNNGYGYVSADYVTDVKEGTVTINLRFGKDYYYVDQGSKVNMGIALTGYVINYSSENSSAAPISSDGVVTGNTPGLYTITASVGSATATAEVVVLKAKNNGVQPMTISDKGAQFIADWEGGGTPFGETIVFYPYQDAAGYWTVGYGHAITTAESKSWTREQAIAQFNTEIAALLGEGHEMTDERPYLTLEEATSLLNADLNKGPYVAAVSDWAVRNGVKLTQQQFDALVSFCFNLGPAYWTSDTYYFYLKSAIIAYRSGDDAVPEQIIEGFTRYIKAGGSNLKGLWWRRRNEAEMFLEGDYAIDRENKFTLPNITWG